MAMISKQVLPESLPVALQAACRAKLGAEKRRSPTHNLHILVPNSPWKIFLGFVLAP